MASLLRDTGLGLGQYESANDLGRGEVELFCSVKGHLTDFHFDFQENFTIQVSGKKTWRLAASPVRHPLRGHTPHYDTPEVVEGQLKAARLSEGADGFQFAPDHLRRGAAAAASRIANTKHRAGGSSSSSGGGGRSSSSSSSGSGSSSSSSSGSTRPNSTGVAAGEDVPTVQEVTLGPGDVLYFPAGMWHSVETVETGVSINVSLMAKTWAEVVCSGLQHLLWKSDDWRACVCDSPARPADDVLGALLVDLGRRLQGGQLAGADLLPPCLSARAPLVPTLGEESEGDGDGEGGGDGEGEDIGGGEGVGEGGEEGETEGDGKEEDDEAEEGEGKEEEDEEGSAKEEEEEGSEEDDSLDVLTASLPAMLGDQCRTFVGSRGNEGTTGVSAARIRLRVNPIASLIAEVDIVEYYQRTDLSMREACHGGAKKGTASGGEGGDASLSPAPVSSSSSAYSYMLNVSFGNYEMESAVRAKLSVPPKFVAFMEGLVAATSASPAGDDAAPSGAAGGHLGDMGGPKLSPSSGPAAFRTFITLDQLEATCPEASQEEVAQVIGCLVFYGLLSFSYA